MTKLLHHGTKHDGRNRNVNKTHLRANSSGLPQYGTKTQNGASSHNIFVDHCCEITERSEIDLASSAIRQGRLGSSNLFSATCA